MLIPAERLTDWTVGTRVGVPGGIPTDRTNIIDVTAAPYLAAGVITETTGAINSGEDTVTVASTASFQEGQYISIGLPSIQEIEITGAATSTGSLQIQIGAYGAATTFSVSIPVVNGDSPSTIGAAIRTANFPAPWVVGGSGGVVTFTETYAGPRILVSFPGTTCGVTADFTDTQTGVIAAADVYITDITGLVLTLSGDATATVTGAIVAHNDSYAIQAAHNAAGAGDILYFPEGIYRTDNYLTITLDEITIRGDGPESTIFRPSGSAGSVFSTSASDFNFPSPALDVTAGLAKDSTSITVSDATDISVGQLVLLRFDNVNDTESIEDGEVPVLGWGSVNINDRVRTQVTRVTAKVGDVLTIHPGIYHDQPNWGAKLSYSITECRSLGFEDFSINLAYTAASNALSLHSNYGSWVKNVEIHNLSNYGISAYGCLNCEFRGVYIHDRKAGGSNGAGLLYNLCCGNLLEDSILWNAQPCIELNSGSSGNVFGYSAIINPAHVICIDSNHGPHNSHNLFEAIIANNFLGDGYFGTESDGTLFRCWIAGTDPSNSAASYNIALKRGTRRYSIVGCIVGKSGVVAGSFSTGEPNIGNSATDGQATPSAGDFWIDWKMTGTLDRLSDTTGEITLVSGSMRSGQANVTLYHAGTDSTYANLTGVTVTEGGSMVNGSTTCYAGGKFTFTIPSGVLPADGSTLLITPHVQGFQEEDLDVAGTIINKGTYQYGAGGASGSMTSLGGDTLPESLYTTQAELEARGVDFTGVNFPCIDPTDPGSVSFASNPPGKRFMDDLPDTVPEFVADPEIEPDGEPAQGQPFTIFRGLVTANPEATLTSQVIRCDADGEEIEDIPGATGLTYIPTADDVGGRLRVRSDADNGVGTDTATSAATAVIQPFLGDADIINQTVNALPVSELWVINGVPVLHEHSGNYPQLDGTGTQNTATTYTLPNVGEIAFHGGDNKQVYGWLTSQLVGANNAARLAYALSIRP